MKQTLNRLTPFFPTLGLLLILGGGVAYFITRRWDLLPNLLLAGGALLLLLFAILQPDAVRQLLSGRLVRYGGSTTLAILFFAAIFTIFYYIAYQNSDWRYDTTETSEFTPLPETIELLNRLEQPVHVLAFYSTQSGGRTQAEEQLNALQAYSEKLTYEFIDPVANPLAAQQYDISPSGTMVFTTNNGEVAAESSGLTDRAIHTALLKIIDPGEKKVYFLTGHGELDTEDFSQLGLSTAASVIQDLGYTLDKLDLRVAGAVPADAVAVAMIGQQVPAQPEEVEALRTYLNNGGSFFIARDLLEEQSEQAVAQDPLTAMLRDEWGVVIRYDLIIDPVSFFAGQEFSPIGVGYGNSPVTNDLDQYGTVFNLARSIESLPVDGVTAVNLVTTSNEAWGEANLAGVQQNFAELNEGEDVAGPLTLGVSAENGVSNGRLIVFGDTDFLGNSAISIGGNNLLFSNALNWLADDEVVVDLTPRETVDRQVLVDQSQLGILWIMAVCLGPGIMAAIGISIWYARRNKR